MIIDAHWDKESIDFKKILLDGDNPRIPSRFHGDHDAVFKFLLQNEEVVGLANSIIRSGGLYPSEAIICLKESEDSYIVLEGNRRLSAVRILHDPELLKIAGIRSLQLNRFEPSLLENIRYLEASIVTSRRVAKPVIAALHLGGGKHPWSDRRKVTFAALEARQGTSYTEISDILLCSEAQAMEYVCFGRILDGVQNLGWTDAEFDILDNDKFRLSVLFKALTSNVAQTHFGQPIFMKNGEVNRQLPEYDEIIRKIVADSLFWQAGQEVLFTLNENTSLSTYFRQRFPSRDERDANPDLFNHFTPPPREHRPTEAHDTSSNADLSAESPQTGETSESWNRFDPKVFFENLVYRGTDLRTGMLVRELSRLSSKSYENQKRGFQIFPLSASFLMRATLEWTIHVRIRDRGCSAGFNDLVGRGRPSLDHYLSFAISNRKDLGISNDTARKVETIRSDTALKNDLQWNVHNDRGNVSDVRLSEIAIKVRPLIEYFLSDSV